jgi:hypothetical protein
LKFELIDDDGNNSFDLIGTHETSMGTVMGSKAQTLTAQLDIKGDKKSGKLGTLIVRAEAVKTSNTMCSFQLRGMNLPN